jgi:hypothetical protein
MDFELDAETQEVYRQCCAILEKPEDTKDNQVTYLGENDKDINSPYHKWGPPIFKKASMNKEYNTWKKVCDFVVNCQTLIDEEKDIEDNKTRLQEFINCLLPLFYNRDDDIKILCYHCAALIVKKELDFEFENIPHLVLTEPSRGGQKFSNYNNTYICSSSSRKTQGRASLGDVDFNSSIHKVGVEPALLKGFFYNMIRNKGFKYVHLKKQPFFPNFAVLHQYMGYKLEKGKEKKVALGCETCLLSYRDSPEKYITSMCFIVRCACMASNLKYDNLINFRVLAKDSSQLAIAPLTDFYDVFYSDTGKKLHDDIKAEGMAKKQKAKKISNKKRKLEEEAEEEDNGNTNNVFEDKQPEGF